MRQERIFPQLIREVCAEAGWKLDAFSQDWILQISDNEKILHIYGYKWGLNNGAAQIVADDKSATAQLLAHYGVNHIPHRLIFHSSYQNTRNIEDDAKLDFILECQEFPLVIKPKNGSIGNHVYKAFSQDEAKKYIYKLFSFHQDVVISPFVFSELEYRCIVLNDEVLLTHSKEPPRVVGDGEKTVRDILHTRTPIGNESILLETLSPSVLDQIILHRVSRVVSWKHNLSKGATAQYVPEPPQEVTTLALQAATALGLTLCSVDMLYDITNNSWKVLEVNSGVSLNKCLPYIPEGREKAKEIYRKAMSVYFDK